VVSLIDNFLYAVLVANELRIHTLGILLSIIGSSYFRPPSQACNTPGGLPVKFNPLLASDLQPFLWTLDLETYDEASFHSGISFGFPNSFTTTEIVDVGNLKLTDGFGQDVTSRISFRSHRSAGFRFRSREARFWVESDCCLLA
jgi:hypothetical protein